MSIKLSEAELKVMKVLWEHGDTTAKNISMILGEKVGWNINTTYTMIKICIKKGAVERSEPNFMCHALVTADEVRTSELNEIFSNLCDNSQDLFFAALVNSKAIDEKHMRELREWIMNYDPDKK